MRKRKVAIASEFAADTLTQAATQEDLLNLYVQITGEREYDGKAVFSLIATPAAIDHVDLDTRDIVRLGSGLFLVGGGGMWRISDNGTILQRVASWDLSGRASVAVSANHMVIVDGDKGYNYDGDQVRSIDFGQYAPPHTVVYASGYFVMANRDVFFTAELGAPGNLDGLNFARPQKDIGEITEIVYLNRELVVISDRTMDFWQLRQRVTEDELFPFQVVPTYGNDYGGRFGTTEIMGNTLFWLADNDQVYMLRGHAPVRVSNQAVEEWVAAQDEVNAWSYEHEGHACYALRSGDEAVVYDATTQRWHRRTGHGFWRTRVIRGEVYGCGRKLSRLVSGKSEHETVRECIMPPIFSGSNNFFRVSEFELDLRMVQGTVGLSTSKDNGATWSQWRNKVLETRHSHRVSWPGIGSVRQLAVRLRLQSAYPVEIVGAHIE